MDQGPVDTVDMETSEDEGLVIDLKEGELHQSSESKLETCAVEPERPSVDQPKEDHLPDKPKPVSKPLCANEAALATLEIKLKEFAAKVSSEKFRQQNTSDKVQTAGETVENEGEKQNDNSKQDTAKPNSVEPRNDCASGATDSLSGVNTTVTVQEIRKDETEQDDVYRKTPEKDQVKCVKEDEDTTPTVSKSSDSNTNSTVNTTDSTAKTLTDTSSPGSLKVNVTEITSNPQKASLSTPRTPVDERKLTLDWNSVGVHRCQVCRFSTDQEDIFRNHTTTCTPARQPEIDGPVLLSYNGDYVCETCKITWKVKAEFEEHLVCHLFGEPYVCMTCKETFSSRAAIEHHAKNDHPKGESRCGLRGVKKGRRVIEELEVKKKYKVFGKLSIAKTPRNQIKTDEVDGRPVTSSENVGKLHSTPAVISPATSGVPSTSSSDPENIPRVITQTVNSSDMLVSNVTKMAVTSMPANTNTSSLNPQANGKGAVSTNTQTDAKSTKHDKPGKVVKTGQEPKTYTFKNYEFPTPPPPPYRPPAASTLKPALPVTVTTSSQPVWLIPLQYAQATSNNPVLIPVPLQQGSSTPVILPGDGLQKGRPQAPIMIPGPTAQPVVQADRTLPSRTVHYKPGQLVTPAMPGSIEIRHHIQTSMSAHTQPSTTAGPKYLQGFNGPALVRSDHPSQPHLVPSVALLPATTGSSICTTEDKHRGTSAPLVRSLPDGHEKTGVTVDSGKHSSKKFLFRIKPGCGFVCEACRKFTQDEVIFRKHVWDHFHRPESVACKTCDQTKIKKREFMKCQLVSDITNCLIKRSTAEPDTKKNILLGSGSTPDKPITLGEEDSITISDDEEEKQQKSSEESVKRQENDASNTEPTAIIVLDEENCDSEKQPDLQIKITSTYTLQANADHGSFEAMQQESAGLSGEESTKESSQTGSVNSNGSGATSAEMPPVKEPQLEKKSLSSDVETENLESQPDNLESQPKSQNVLQDKDDTDAEGNDSVRVTRTHQIKVTKQTARSRTSSPMLQGQNGTDSVNTAIHTFEEHIQKGNPANSFYICGFERCSFASCMSSKYKEHLASEHVGTYNYVCCHCGLKNLTDDSHVRHLASHANAKSFVLFNCAAQGCKYRTNLVKLFQEHVQCHNAFKCSYCHKVFQDSKTLINHLKDNLLQFVNCPNCSFKHASRGTVVQHLHLLHPDKPRMITVTSQIVCREREQNFYSLPFARQSFSPPPEFQDILNIPGNNDSDVDVETPYDGCLYEDEPITDSELPSLSKFFNIENSENQEMNESPPDETGDHTAHPETQRTLPESQKNKKDVAAEGPKSLRCPVCNYLSWNQMLFADHSTLHDQEPQREKRFVCMYCPKGINYFSKFKKHVSNHIGKHTMVVFTCTVCVFSSNQKYHIIDHVKDNHQGGATYTERTEVFKSSEFTCSHCDYKSRQAEHVSMHEQAVHGGQLRSQKTSSAPRKSIPVPAPVSTIKPPETDTTKSSHKYHCHYCENSFKHKSQLRSHMRTQHRDIEKKTFVTYKCKYCHYSSTKKDVILVHTDKKHATQPAKILRRTEYVEDSSEDKSGSEDFTAVESDPSPSKTSKHPSIDMFHCEFCDFSINSQAKLNAHVSLYHTPATDSNTDTERVNQQAKEEVQVPDGNIYKNAFVCPKCPFTSKIRINVMRHIKCHSELLPVRMTATPDLPSTTSTKKMHTARKSTTAGSKRPSVLSSPTKHLANPFASVKEKIEKEKSMESGANLSDQYKLEDDKLHKKLSACFIPLENDAGFKCRICQQLIAKKYVLHRHILDHLEIVFFRCNYCDEGSIDQTLMLGHIHKDHPLKQVAFKSFSMKEIDEQLMNKILNQNFNDSVDIFEKSDKSEDNSSRPQGGVVKQKIHETVQQKDVPPVNSPPDIKLEPNEKGEYKCTLCNYKAKKAYHIERHMNDHKDTVDKKFGCTVCGYKANYKGDVLKHTDTQHPGSPRRVINLKDDKRLGSVESGSSVSDTDRARRSESAESKVSSTTLSSDTSSCKIVESGEKNVTPPPQDSYVRNVKGKKIKTDQIKVSSAGVFEMRVVYKCKECGERRSSKGSMYDHFRSSRCNRPWYQCNYCCLFISPAKSAIIKHSRIRHVGAKVAFSELPLSSKMKVIKFPVKSNELNRANIASSEEKEREISPDQESQNSVSSTTSVGSVSSGPKKLVCKICMNYKGDSVMRLQFHINTKHGGKTLYCINCKYKTTLVKHMLNHCANVHGMKSARYSQGDEHSHFKLEHADENKIASPTSTAVVADKKDSSKPKQEIKFSPKSETTITGKRERKKGTRMYKCLKCAYESDIPKKVRLHMGIHFNYKPYVCKYCGRRLQYENNLRRHVNVAHPGKDLKFSIQKDDAMEAKLDKMLRKIKRLAENPALADETALTQSKQLQRFEAFREEEARLGILRLKENMFGCKFCSYRNSRRYQIKRHIERMHSIQNSSGKRKADTEEDDAPPKKIQKSIKHAAVKAEPVAEHSDTEQSVDEPDGEDGEEREIESSPMKFRVARDPDSGERLYQCLHCEYKTKKKKNLHNHMVSHGSKNYKCWYCQYSSKLICNAYRHIENVHKGKPLHVVNIRRKKVMSPKKMRPETRHPPAASVKSITPSRSEVKDAPSRPGSHHQRKSASVLSYCCNICDFKVTGLYHYRQHLATHSDFRHLTKGTDIESRLSCGYCSYMAVDSVDFSNHVAIHLDERPYKCGYCDYSDYNRAKVRYHNNNSHPDEEELIINLKLGTHDVRSATQVMLVNCEPRVMLRHSDVTNYLKRTGKAEPAPQTGDAQQAMDDSDSGSAADVSEEEDSNRPTKDTSKTVLHEETEDISDGKEESREEPLEHDGDGTSNSKKQEEIHESSAPEDVVHCGSAIEPSVESKEVCEDPPVLTEANDSKMDVDDETGDCAMEKKSVENVKEPQEESMKTVEPAGNTDSVTLDTNSALSSDTVAEKETSGSVNEAGVTEKTDEDTKLPMEENTATQNNMTVVTTEKQKSGIPLDQNDECLTAENSEAQVGPDDDVKSPGFEDARKQVDREVPVNTDIDRPVSENIVETPSDGTKTCEDTNSLTVGMPDGEEGVQHIQTDKADKTQLDESVPSIDHEKN